MPYVAKYKYRAKTPEGRARQLAGLKSNKGMGRKLKPDDLRYKIKDDIIQFVQKDFYIPETRSPIVLLDYEIEFFNDLFHSNPTPTLCLLGTPKKCGKSTIAAMICLFVLCTRRDAEIYIVGPDIEQSQLVVYSKIRKAIRLNPYLQKFIVANKAEIINRKNDSFVRPLACSSTNAGLSPAVVVFDELWRFTSDEAITSYEELTNIPFEGNLNLVVTYAGFSEDEDSILYRLYKQGVEQRDGYANRDRKFLFRWYGEDLYPEIPWVTQNYLTLQKNRLRPNSYARLHQNLWVSGAESFVDSKILDSCTHNHRKGVAFDGQVVIGVDIGLKSDCSAICVVGKIDSDNLILIDHKLFIPDEKRHQVLDLESTVEKTLLHYNKKYRVKKILYDPYQFQRSASTLRKSKLRMIEFPQTQSNTVEMSETLSDLLHNQRLMIYPDQELRLHLLNAQAKETQRGWRIVKKRQSRKIDLTIALALAVQGATKSFLTSSTRKGYVYVPDSDSPAKQFHEMHRKSAFGENYWENERKESRKKAEIAMSSGT